MTDVDSERMAIHVPAGKIGGQARAMIVSTGIERAVQYFNAFKAYLAERKSPYQAIVAFSGELNTRA